MLNILHIDFNSYFATVEQQANPRLRGKPIGVTGGDRETRTVLGAASIEAKKFGVKTGMPIWEAKKMCPQIILVQGDSDKYLYVTTKFLNIVKRYTHYVEVFSIDEVFLEISPFVIASDSEAICSDELDCHVDSRLAMAIANQIRYRIKTEIGEWMSVSIGISYNKLMAKLASGLQKPDGLVSIANEEQAMRVLENISLDKICGIGPMITKRLHRMGIFTFKQLRQISLDLLVFEFKSYGHFLYNAARGIDHTPIIPFYDKEEVKSVGHRYTISHDTNNEVEIKQIMLKLTELIARKLRAKRLVGRTVHYWYRLGVQQVDESGQKHFIGDGMQSTIPWTSDGLEIFQAAWELFHRIWSGEKIRMVGVSISNLKPENPQTLTLLEEPIRQQKIIAALDTINNKFGEFTLQRGILLKSSRIIRKANSFLSDRRFKV